MTCILREMPMGFQVLHVNDVAPWYRWLDGLGLTCICELNYKEQFNRVKPEWVTGHMRDASAWLYKRRQWRSSELTWSIHRTQRSLDRVGRATARYFTYVTHES